MVFHFLLLQAIKSNGLFLSVTGNFLSNFVTGIEFYARVKFSKFFRTTFWRTWVFLCNFSGEFQHGEIKTPVRSWEGDLDTHIGWEIGSSKKFLFVNYGQPWISEITSQISFVEFLVLSRNWATIEFNVVLKINKVFKVRPKGYSFFFGNHICPPSFLPGGRFYGFFSLGILVRKK